MSDRIEYAQWSKIEQKFKKAIELNEQIKALKGKVIKIRAKKIGPAKESLDDKLRMYNSKNYPRIGLMEDLFEYFIEHVFTGRSDYRGLYSRKFSKLIFNDEDYLTKNFLSAHLKGKHKLEGSELFNILFAIYQLDASKLSSVVGKGRKYTQNSLNLLKSKCYVRIKKFFLDNQYSVPYVSETRDYNNLKVGSAHFNNEFDLSWAVWYAYVEWYTAHNPSLKKDIFTNRKSQFRQLFVSENFLNVFFGKTVAGGRTPLLSRMQGGYYFSRKNVLLMLLNLRKIQKSSVRSTYPNIHAIDNAFAECYNYLSVRYPTGKDRYFSDDEPYFSVNIANAKKANLPDIFIKRLIEAELLDGNFPFSANGFSRIHPDNYLRASDAYKQISVGGSDQNLADKRKVITDRIKSGEIINIDSNSPVSSKLVPIRELIRIVNNYKGDKLAPVSKWPSHSGIAEDVERELSNYIVSTEPPIWSKTGSKLVTGHPDIILVIDGVLYICDYKPDGTPNPLTTELKKSFIESIPQLAVYSKILKAKYGIKEIRCVTFNKEGAWIYEDSMLGHIEKFMKDKGISDHIVWNGYI